MLLRDRESSLEDPADDEDAAWDWYPLRQRHQERGHTLIDIKIKVDWDFKDTTYLDKAEPEVLEGGGDPPWSDEEDFLPTFEPGPEADDTFSGRSFMHEIEEEFKVSMKTCIDFLYISIQTSYICLCVLTYK